MAALAFVYLNGRLQRRSGIFEAVAAAVAAAVAVAVAAAVADAVAAAVVNGCSIATAACALLYV